ncbi:hypothetical protein DWB77_02928 [Streptomyces hundungensis]|uniref:Uncharacterized protein n=1 Tax=Streptomyces hundungensis TaxID=1077946 RepID=A0A387HIW3_9ACTN|nr:hypothetical protein DWB77_02928 [Streptomyces hundungensis]
MRCYWDEEDTWFYFEVDATGWVIRQIELEGPGLTPVAAASLCRRAAFQTSSNSSRVRGSGSWPSHSETGIAARPCTAVRPS